MKNAKHQTLPDSYRDAKHELSPADNQTLTEFIHLSDNITYGLSVASICGTLALMAGFVRYNCFP